MAFRSRPEVFLCASDAEFRRVTGTAARFCAINGRTFVSARAQDDARRGEIDLRTYLTHELSHCLLQQNISFVRSLKMPRWLLEGAAMDCAGQVGTGIYPARSRVNELMAAGAFCEPADFGTFWDGEKGTAISCPVDNQAAFFYSEFGCLVGHLRQRYGDDRFREFLRNVVEGERLDVAQSFEDAFGTSLDDEVRRFKADAIGHAAGNADRQE